MWDLYHHCEHLIRPVVESCLRSVWPSADGTSAPVVVALIGLGAILGSLNTLSDRSV